MNKPLLISAAAAVILTVVLCTAGCISPADEIVGSWLEETDDAVTYAVFAEDGTGFFAADKDSVLTLEWKANGDTTYTFIFADGTTKTGTLNALRGAMTMSDGCVLEKQASEVSGVAMVPDSLKRMLVTDASLAGIPKPEAEYMGGVIIGDIYGYS